jgi:hypothetical protein
MSYSYQEPTHLCTSYKDVERLYKETRAKDEFDGKDRFERTSKVLGNPILKSFHTDMIVPAKLKGLGPQKNRVVTMEVNRKLKHLYEAAFEKILAENLPYVIHDVGTYLFRYKQNGTVKAAIANRPEYAELRKLPDFWPRWNVLCAEYDRDHGTFEEVIPYDGGTRIKKNLLSNHSWGSAIDINPTTNPFSKNARFDMPLRIVEIMEGFGFHWGGYYHDYMHFEFARTRIVGVPDEEPAQVLFPFSASPQRESPLKYYFFNEGSAGGYFPLGKQQNLHAGVHLEPDSREALVPVRAAMPGYIVAARLMTPGKEGDSPFLLEATEGRPLGFVLIRHELSAMENGKPADEVHPLYSLYMHLAPPRWGQAEADKEFEKAPWLASFLQMQHGAVVNLDPASEDAGKTFWATAPLDAEAASFQVKDRPQPLKGKVDGRMFALTKPCPEDVAEAIDAFKKGSIVTFDRPLFPVATGDIIGFVAQGSPVPGEGGPPASSSSRYLHWELFSLSGDQGGLNFLTEKDPELKRLLVKVEEKRKDNFLRMPSDGAPDADNEVNTLLGSTGVEVVQALKRARYGRTLREYFNDGTKFFSAEATSAKPFTWPLPLTLENKYKYGGPCTLEVLYKKAGQPHSREVFNLSPRNQGTLNVTLNVPADADALALWSPHFFADPVELESNVLRQKRLESRTKLFQKAARHRWRNLVLEHVNEWTPEGLGLQLDARKEAGLFDHLEDTPDITVEKLKKQLLPLCWWARPATREDPFGEVPVLGAEQKSLFGTEATQLPESAELVNMHPVTALWLMDLLLEKEAIAIRKEWPPATLKRDESNEKPLYLGLLSKEPTVLSGVEMLAVLVQHGYGTTAGTNGIDVTFWLAPKGEASAGQQPRSLCRAPYVDGVALARIRAPAWGHWEVSATATGSDTQRFEPTQTHATAFEVPKPVLTGQPFTLGTKPAKLRPLATGSFVVSENWPFALAGYIVFEYWKVPPKGSPEPGVEPIPGSLAVPVIAERPAEERTAGGLKFKGDFIVGREKNRSNPKVTPNFSFQEFVNHPRLGRVFPGDEKTEFLLAVPLAQRLQELREQCKPKGAGTKDLPISVKRLTRSGLSLLVTPSSGTAADFELLAAKLPLLKPSEFFTDERVDDELAIRITYQPPRSAGVLQFEFDPAPALGRLAAAALSGETAGETLHVRPRLIVPSTGHSPHMGGALPPVEGVPNLFSASAAQLKAACGNDVLELVADKLLHPVARFEFGDIQLKMGAGKLRTEVALHGDANQWKVAEPLFKLAGASQSKRVGNVLQADWPLIDKQGQRIPAMWSVPLTFTAEVSQPDKVPTPPPPVKHEPVMIEPRLEALTHAVRPKELGLVGKGHFIPTDADFRIICERLDASTGQWMEDSIVNSAIRYKTPGDAAYGRCTELGVFEASVPKAALKKAGGPFRFTWRRRPNKEGTGPRPVLGVILAEPSTPEITLAELGL